MEPMKKRRRWLIVAFILVLASTAAWWWWPRGDARFVGKWRLSNDPDGVWHLRSNGIATWQNSSISYPTVRTTWRVHGDMLQFGASPFRPNRPTINWLINLWNSHARTQWMVSGGVYKILTVQPESLHCTDGAYEGGDVVPEDEETPGSYVFSRVPD